ncbi:hypothetical protein [Methylobacterium sp. 285MFTsu5.1]|uniref:hypothetical protein n=1 Tax=Methylobacterium sp. 285MFTsu5.1 TaxID=1172187 RepID=UPI00037471DF|nr:hypothetical protein [Methylobacterium sp. 285MFTsu5.1]
MPRQKRQFMRQGVSDLPTRTSVKAYVGAPGEPIFDFSTLRMQDGVTPGGIPLLSPANDLGLSDGEKAQMRLNIGVPAPQDMPVSTAQQAVFDAIIDGADAAHSSLAKVGTLADAATAAAAVNKTNLAGLAQATLDAISGKLEKTGDGSGLSGVAKTAGNVSVSGFWGFGTAPGLHRMVNPEYMGVGGNVGTGGVIIGGGTAAQNYQGTILSNDGHPNWTKAVSSLNYNPTEWIVGGAGAQGRASTTGTNNVVTRVDGTAFDPAWVGYRFYLNRVPYRVATVASDGGSLTVTNLDGSAVTLPALTNVFFQFILTTGSGRANVVNGVVTIISGTPFIPFSGTNTDFRITVNGVVYTSATFNSPTKITIPDTTVNASNVAYSYGANINDQVAAFRVGKQNGAIEETLTVSGRATGEWEISFGSYNEATNPDPGRIKSGIRNGARLTQIEVRGNGLSLCGVAGSEAVRVSNDANMVNRIELAGTPAGFAVGLRARGADTNLGFAFDTQGAGGMLVTGRSFGQPLFEVAGAVATGLSWPLMVAGTTPRIQPGGTNNTPMAVVGSGNAGALLGVFARAVDPTTADIPAGQAAIWVNTSANTTKLVTNVGGVLKSVAMT